MSSSASGHTSYALAAGPLGDSDSSYRRLALYLRVLTLWGRQSFPSLPQPDPGRPKDSIVIIRLPESHANHVRRLLARIAMSSRLSTPRTRIGICRSGCLPQTRMGRAREVGVDGQEDRLRPAWNAGGRARHLTDWPITTLVSPSRQSDACRLSRRLRSSPSPWTGVSSHALPANTDGSGVTASRRSGPQAFAPFPDLLPSAR
jgi:hypothetical protein